MTPNKLGRYCQLCDKTVIDFTKMSPNEIKVYLKKNGQKRICGRIPREPIKTVPSKKEQWFNSLRVKINQRITFSPIRISLLSILGLMMALVGCNQNATKNKSKDEAENIKIPKNDSIPRDSVDLINEPRSLLGNIARPEDMDHSQPLLGEVDDRINGIPLVGKIAIGEDIDTLK
jgi:hypothetical protein